MREANAVLAQSTNTTSQWTTEYVKAFTPQNRAKFPANRESLQASADKIIKILNENERLSNEAIAKYEQATALITDEQQRRGTTMLISALKTSLQISDLFKSQMQLVSDEKIATEQAFNEKFAQITNQIVAASKENQAQFDEGRRLLGM
jgi:hypothetical protein